MPLRRQRTPNGRCQAKTKSGERCAAPAMRGQKYCSLHTNPARASELGRKGGLGNRHRYKLPSDLVKPPESAADVRRMLAATMADVRAGKMDPKVANAVAYVGFGLLRAYETAAESDTEAHAKEPYVPLIYQSLTRPSIYRGLNSQPPTEIHDYQTGKLIAPTPPALPAPAPAPAAKSPETAHAVQEEESPEVEILDYENSAQTG